MTLDQSLANLQHQADRLANLFGATADAIEARTGAAAKTVAESFHGVGQAAPLDVRQDTPPGVVATTDGSLLNFEGENYVPQTPPELLYDPAVGEHHWAMAQPETPQGASPSSAPTMAAPPASAVEVEGPGAPTPETPRPAGPVAEAPPWDDSTTVVEETPKKSGRRTNEELAAELGVRLDDVKTWKGGGRISKADMEEFKRLHPDAVVGQQVAQPAQPMPTQASDPMGAPQYNQGGVLPAAAPAQGPPQEWPTAQPVAAQPAAGEQFGEWQQAAASESQWDPFKA